MTANKLLQSCIITFVSSYSLYPPPPLMSYLLLRFLIMGSLLDGFSACTPKCECKSKTVYSIVLFPPVCRKRPKVSTLRAREKRRRESATFSKNNYPCRQKLCDHLHVNRYSRHDTENKTTCVKHWVENVRCRQKFKKLSGKLYDVGKIFYSMNFCSSYLLLVLKQ